jgi:hypothetical protein
MSRKIPATNEILTYAHCGQCLDSLPKNESPASYARLSVGFTEIGLQIWCERHNMNVLSIDFEGKKHPANNNGIRPAKGSVVNCESCGSTAMAIEGEFCHCKCGALLTTDQ